MIDLGVFGSRRVPFVAATALNECGLACLAAVSEYFRGELALVDIRRLAVHSGRGETLLDLRNIAERMGLTARGVRLEVRGLAALAKPAILHWDMNHFVLIERVTKNGIIVMDPAAGRLEVPWSEVDKSFTGVALELAPSERWRQRLKPSRKVSVLDFVGPFSHWRKDLTLIIALSLLLEVFVLLMPLQMQLSIDNAVLAADGKLVWVLGIGFALFALIQASVGVMRAWSTAVFGARVGFELRDRFVRALHQKSARFFLTHHTADILNRGRSVDMIQSLVTAQLIQALLDALMSIALLTVMFVTMPLLATVVVIFALVNVGVTAGLRHAAVENSRRHLRVAAKADALFLENARAARAIKLFGKESVRTSVWRNKLVDLTNLTLGAGRLNMFSMQGAQATSSLGGVALIAASTYFVINNTITLGTMMMFFVFRTFFVERLNHCVNYLMELRRVQTHAERIDEVMATEEGARDELAHEPFVVPAEYGVGLEVRDLWFRYGDDSPWIFKGASFRIEPGESVAIAGPSGSGKTTLMNILLGLLEPTRGEVLVNGRDLKTIASYDYAKVIGAVMQDDTLFHGTVAENISFFDAPFDMERVVRAAEKANIARDIAEMPMQYYALLAEAALNISGGQKQRLFIARAVYHEPKVLFLDEATSHLDPENERLVSQAVSSMNLTRVLIAHRRETIATADRVLYLDQSGLVLPQEDRSSRTGHAGTIGSGCDRNGYCEESM